LTVNVALAYSTPVPCRTLAEYIARLVALLGEHEPEGLARLRSVIGARLARITLDDESVLVHFSAEQLVVVPANDPDRSTEEAGEARSPAPPARVVDGEGGTDRLTTFALLDGRLDVTEAVVTGRLQARGDIENLSRIFHAVEILIDAATRVPSLQRLSAEYLGDPCRVGRPPFPGGPIDVWRADRLRELEMLDRLDLLP